MESVIVTRGLTRDYEGGVRALRGIDVEVADGEFVAVTGPSGCGKSTLLNLLGGLDRPTAGEIELGGRRVDGYSEANLLLFRAIMQAMSPSEGTDIVGTPGPFALALVLPFVLAVTALASSLPGRSAARASAAGTLRAE